jgi:hypothetical protein
MSVTLGIQELLLGAGREFVRRHAGDKVGG